MNRTIAGLAVAATAATLLTAAPAQAAPIDPVKALKSQLVAGRGMTFTEATKINGPGFNIVFSRRTGTMQFAPSGPVAADMTGKINLPTDDLPEDADENLRAMATPEHVIWLKNRSYISGGLIGSLLPEDKTWFSPRGPGMVSLGLSGTLGQVINVAEPATFKALLAKATVTGNTYRGSITFGELNKVSPWFRYSWMGRMTPKAAKFKLNWKLLLDGRRLPQRLTTSYDGAAIGIRGAKLIIDSRFANWGTKVATIKAPPADEVTTRFDTGSDEIPDLPFIGGSGR